MSRFCFALCLFCWAASAFAQKVEPTAQIGPTKGPAPEARPAMLSDAWTGTFSALLSEQAAVRQKAARALAQTEVSDEDGEARLAAALRQELSGSQTHYQKLIHAIWGQYPNPEYPRGPGKDPPMWLVRPEPPIPPGTPKKNRPKPHDPEAVDWLSALADLSIPQDPFLADFPSAELHKARAELLFKVALLRALSLSGQKGSQKAVLPVFDLAFVREGILRDECGRQIRAMGSFAIPALLRIYYNRARSNYKMRRYASYQLDRMDRLRPGKAIASAQVDSLRADILHTYGEVLAIDAVEAVLEQVSARSRRVRREARWAFLRYVDGPPPPPPPKRKRKLPGGKEEAEEKEDYLSYRDLATLKLREHIKKVLGREPAETVTAKQMTDELFAHYDKEEEAQFAKLFETASAHAAAGRFKEAVSEYDFILANQPDHPRRSEMALAFRRYGEDLAHQAEKRDDDALRSQAVGWLRQAALLAGAGPEHGKLLAQIHLLDGVLALRKGGDGRSDFAAALSADPDCHEAQTLLSRGALSEKRKNTLLRWLTLVLFGSGLLLFGVHRRLTCRLT